MDILKLILAILAMVVVLPIGILWLRDRHICPKPTKAELDEQASKFEERLLNPDFQVVEHHFAHPLPQSIHDLYANQQEVLRVDFLVSPTVDTSEEDAWFVAFYEPCDAEAGRQFWPGCEQYFSFANDGFGNDYIVVPGKQDSPVLFMTTRAGISQRSASLCLSL